MVSSQVNNVFGSICTNCGYEIFKSLHFGFKRSYKMKILIKLLMYELKNVIFLFTDFCQLTCFYIFLFNFKLKKLYSYKFELFKEIFIIKRNSKIFIDRISVYSSGFFESFYNKKKKTCNKNRLIGSAIINC